MGNDVVVETTKSVIKTDWFRLICEPSQVITLLIYAKKMGWYSIVVIMVSVLGLMSLPASAQSGILDWSEPVRISGGTTGTYPVVTTDLNGQIHVMYLGADEAKDSIYYVYWDGTRWSEPVDILVTPDRSNAADLVVTSDSGAVLHVIWRGQRLYYAQAPAAGAASARSWTPTKVLPTGAQPFHADIFADGGGAIHVVFPQVDDPRGVYYIRSDDGGATWSTPVLIDGGQGPNISASDTRVFADPTGKIHVAWSEFQLPAGWPPLGVYYAQSSDGGQSWSASEIVAEGTYALPTITGRGNGEIHLVWSGTGDATGRYHRWSSDGGTHWSPVEYILTDVMGLHSFSGLAVDGDDRLYLVSSGVDRVTGQRLFYSVWTGSNWLPKLTPDAVPNGDFYSSEIAVSEGNRLNWVFSDANDNSIWYSTARTSAPYEPPLPTLQPTVTPAPTATRPNDKPTLPVGTSWSAKTASADPGPPGTTSPSTPLIWGMVSSVAVCALVFVIRLSRSGRRS